MKLIVDIDKNLFTRLFDNGDNEIDDMAEALAVLRKGIPAPKGKWIDKKCSSCGSSFYFEEMPDGERYPYCPNCGADMRGDV